jgi:hypothetical protein
MGTGPMSYDELPPTRDLYQTSVIRLQIEEGTSSPHRENPIGVIVVALALWASHILPPLRLRATRT